MLARDDGLEVMAEAPVFQMSLDDGHGAGRRHRHGDVMFVQPGQKLVEAGHFGDRLVEGFIGQPVQLLHDAHGGAVLAVEAPQHIAAAGLGGAAGSLREAILAGQAEFCQCRLPADVPDALGVEHQPVHIKNNTLYHNASSFWRKIYIYTLLYHVFLLLNTDKVIICGNLTAPKMKHFSVACKSVSRHYNRKQHSAYLAQGVQPARRCVRSEKREIYHVGHQDHSYYLPEGKAAGRV